MRFDVGHPWWLDSAELVNEAADVQAARFEGDPWEEVIARWIDGRPSASVSDVLSLGLDKPKALWTQVDKNRVARCFRTLGWERYRARVENGLEWRYRRME